MDATYIIGLIAAIIAIYGILSQRQIARRTNTLEYIRSQEADTDVIKARNNFLNLAEKLNDIAETEHEQSKLIFPDLKFDDIQNIRMVLNEYELISIGIQNGVLDFKMYRDWNKKNIIDHWDISNKYIEVIRTNKNRKIYREFEKLKDWMDKRKLPWKLRYFRIFY